MPSNHERHVRSPGIRSPVRLQSDVAGQAQQPLEKDEGARECQGRHGVAARDALPREHDPQGRRQQDETCGASKCPVRPKQDSEVCRQPLPVGACAEDQHRIGEQCRVTGAEQQEDRVANAKAP